MVNINKPLALNGVGMVVQFPDIEIWQRDILNYYIDNPKGRWIIVKSLRQTGKSFLCKYLLIYTALKKKCVSMLVSPVLIQSRKIYQEICNMCPELITAYNGSSNEITFINGSKILFRSAEQGNTIRGNTITGICILDEAAYIQDDVFYSIIVPTTNVYNTNIFLFSTPKFKRGMFYNLYIRGIADDVRVKSFDWATYDTSKYLPPETLAIYREQMPRLAFQSEFLAEFIDGDGAVFSDFLKCVNANTILYNNRETIIGVDWGTGTGNDYTVLTFGQVQNNKIIVTQQKAFNDKNATETINYIIKEIEALKTQEIRLIVEKNSIGQVYLQLLNDRLPDYVTLEAFNTTNKSKDKIVKQLITVIEQDKIILPNDSRLLSELAMYECKINTNGIATYNAPNGQHDDRVMSLCFLVNILYNEVI